MRLLVGLGFLGLAVWGFKRWRDDVREGELATWWREQQRRAAALEPQG